MPADDIVFCFFFSLQSTEVGISNACLCHGLNAWATLAYGRDFNTINRRIWKEASREDFFNICTSVGCDSILRTRSNGPGRDAAACR